MGGLATPPLVVANFGTAGAYPETWSPGSSLLIHRVVSPAGFSIFPEMALRWAGGETECRTVDRAQATIIEDDCVHGRRPVFDMEAYGVAEATQTFLSTSHLLVGKYVLDIIGDDGSGDWRALTSEHAENYALECLKFLDFAGRLQSFLADDERRCKTVEAQSWSRERLSEVLGVLPLTVTQQRELTATLMVKACEPASGETLSDSEDQIKDCLTGAAPTTKKEVKARLSGLLDRLRRPQ